VQAFLWIPALKPERIGGRAMWARALGV